MLTSWGVSGISSLSTDAPHSRSKASRRMWPTSRAASSGEHHTHTSYRERGEEDARTSRPVPKLRLFTDSPASQSRDCHPAFESGDALRDIASNFRAPLNCDGLACGPLEGVRKGGSEGVREAGPIHTYHWDHSTRAMRSRSGISSLSTDAPHSRSKASRRMWPTSRAASSGEHLNKSAALRTIAQPCSNCLFKSLCSS
jgi:hypothetical protein